MDPNLTALQAAVTQATALLDALYQQYQTDQQTITSLQQQLAAATGSGGSDSASLPALTQALQAAVTRDTPPPPPSTASGSGATGATGGSSGGTSAISPLSTVQPGASSPQTAQQGVPEQPNN